jgi:hypothetical protein
VRGVKGGADFELVGAGWCRLQGLEHVCLTEPREGEGVRSETRLSLLSVSTDLFLRLVPARGLWGLFLRRL